ncbi:hypothetical protein G6F60_013812 [Rhizopus arrhizus]|nr:hypothetical protein G6F60_013812 [Rhizopus arrhizus]
MQVGEAAIDQRTHEVHRHRRMRVGLQHPLRVGQARRFGERRRIDHVTTVAGQGHAIAGFGIGRTRLGVLAGKAPNADHRLAQAVHQHQAHLQQHLQPVGNGARFAVAEILRAVTALQQEALALLRLGQLLLQRQDLPRGDQRRQPLQLMQGRIQRHRVRVGRHLQRGLATPALRRPGSASGGRGRIGDRRNGGQAHCRLPEVGDVHGRRANRWRKGPGVVCTWLNAGERASRSATNRMAMAVPAGA